MSDTKIFRVKKAALIKMLSAFMLLAALILSGRSFAGLKAFAIPPLLEEVNITAPNVPALSSTCGKSTSIDYLMQGVNTGNPGITLDIDNVALLKKLPNDKGVMDYRYIRHSNASEQKYGKSERYQEIFDEGEYELQIEMECRTEGYARGLTKGSMNGISALVGGPNLVANPFFMFYDFTITHKDKKKSTPNTNMTQHWYGICSGCGAKFDLADHTFKTIIDKPATASEEGSKHEECSVCGYKKPPVVIPRHNHTYAGGTGHVIQQADENNHWRYCSTCGEKETNKHSFDLGKVTKQPTTLEEGEKTYTCTACKWVKKETLPKVGAPVETIIHPAGTPLVADDTVFTVKSKATSVEYKMPIGTAVSVKIPATIVIDGINYKVTAIAEGAFKNNNNITSVVIGSNVTEIGEKAFYNCKALNQVTIPASVKKIGAGAFQNCKKLKNITISTTKLTAKTVGAGAFKGTNAKANVKVPAKKLKAYQTLLKNKGIGKKAKIKK